jgi:hypothetical protein
MSGLKPRQSGSRISQVKEKDKGRHWTVWGCSCHQRKKREEEDSLTKETRGELSFTQLSNFHVNHSNSNSMTKTILYFEGFHSKGNPQSGSLARIYLAEQDRVGRNRKRKDEYLLLDT